MADPDLRLVLAEQKLVSSAERKLRKHYLIIHNDRLLAEKTAPNLNHIRPDAYSLPERISRDRTDSYAHEGTEENALRV